MADFSKTPKNEVEKLVLIQIAPQHMTFIEKNYSYYKKVKSWLVLASFWLIWLNFRIFYTRPRSNGHEMLLSSFCAEHDIKRQWYMMYEHGKYADIGKIVEFLGKEVCLALPAIHSLTGCDTTSSFFVLESAEHSRKFWNRQGRCNS